MTDTEIAALVERLNAWGEMGGDTLLEGASFDITRASAAILALQQRVRELEGDARRLDFIERNGLGCDKFGHAEPIFDVWSGGVRYTGKTPRAAIDAAAISEGGKHDEA